MPVTGVEFIYPIVPLHDVDRHVNALDSKEFAATTAEANKVRDLLRFRIDNSNLDALMQFLDLHVASLIELATAGVYPFGQNYTTSNVYLTRYSNLVRESDIRWLLDCEFVFVAGIS